VAKLKITLVRSTSKLKKPQLATLEALGLRKIGAFVEQKDNPQIRGMIKKVEHVLAVEEI
jgi:large subunit ribosomal protein L30